MKLGSIVIALALSACIPPQQGWSPGAAPSGYPSQNMGDPQGGNAMHGNGDQQAGDGQSEYQNGDDSQQTYGPPGPAASAHRSISINGVGLGPAQVQTLARLEATYHVTLPNGTYWYDRVNGGFGVWGQPAAAALPAGLDLGPRLPANASNGTSGVYINNRELQPLEVQFLSTLVGVQWQRGRYFIDAQGNAGLEGGAVLVNLVQVAQQRAPAATGGRQDVSFTKGFGQNQTQFFSSADGSCKSFTSSKGTIFVGC